MTMREKIARALESSLAENRGKFDVGLCVRLDGMYPLELIADAVLEAIRTPTPEMIDAGKQLVLARTGWPTEHAEGVWQFMIDAARTKETV